MKLVPKWPTILRRAWSIRLAILSGIFGGVLGFLPLFTYSVPRWIFAALCLIASVGAVITRLMLQKEFHDDDQ